MATFSRPGRRTCSSGPRTAVCQLEAMRQEIGQRLADAYLLSNMALSALRHGYAAGSIESSTARCASPRS
jgi:hypothetical protein